MLWFQDSIRVPGRVYDLFFVVLVPAATRNIQNINTLKTKCLILASFGVFWTRFRLVVLGSRVTRGQAESHGEAWVGLGWMFGYVYVVFGFGL